jgi:hypothetical protein
MYVLEYALRGGLGQGNEPLGSFKDSISWLAEWLNFQGLFFVELVLDPKSRNGVTKSPLEQVSDTRHPFLLGNRFIIIAFLSVKGQPSIQYSPLPVNPFPAPATPPPLPAPIVTK